MIVKMKKLSLLLHSNEKQKFLKALQDLGVLHIVENPEITSGALQEKLNLCKKYIDIAYKLNKIKKTLKSVQNQEKCGDPCEIINKFEELEKRAEAVDLALPQLKKQESLLIPWGDFDPENIKRLIKCGINVRLFDISLKKYKRLDLKEIAHQIILKDKRNNRVYFVVFEKGKSVVINADETMIPELSLNSILEKIKGLEKEKTAIQSGFEKMACFTELVSDALKQQKNISNFEKAQMNFESGAGGSVAFMEGWIPQGKEKVVKEFLSSFLAWYEIKNPAPGEDVPVLLKNNAFARLLEPITKIFSLPSYYELDPTPFFAPFFVLFVGLCMADVAYGLIIFLIALFAFFKLPSNYAGFIKFFMVLGISVIFGGLMLNGFFGHTIFGGPGIPEGSAYFSFGANYFSVLSPVEGEKGKIYPAMKFAILIGFTQVLLGMTLRTYNQIKNRGLVFGIQPFSYIMMIIGGLIWAAHTNFFNVGDYRLGPLPVGSFLKSPSLIFGKIILCGGAFLMLLFNNPDKKIPIRLSILFLWEMYGFVTGILGDILSYLRLFALGLSGGLLGNAFNYIAFMAITRNSQTDYSSPFIVVTILILIVGHTLNIFLCLIGSFVHPLRLTFVEFYKNLGFQGMGKAYTPFTIIKEI